MRARGHHLTSVALHAGAAALLCAALHAMTGALWRSFAAAALFALHPLQVESVAWAAERSMVLAGLFFALTLLLWGRWVRRPRPALYVAALLAFALALASKPIVVTLPVLLLLLDAGARAPRPREGRSARAHEAGGLVLEKAHSSPSRPRPASSRSSRSGTAARSSPGRPPARRSPRQRGALPRRLSREAAPAGGPGGLLPAAPAPPPPRGGRARGRACRGPDPPRDPRPPPVPVAPRRLALAGRCPRADDRTGAGRDPGDGGTAMSTSRWPAPAVALAWQGRGGVRAAPGASRRPRRGGGAARPRLATARQARLWQDDLALYAHALAVTTDNWMIEPALATPWPARDATRTRCPTCGMRRA